MAGLVVPLPCEVFPEPAEEPRLACGGAVLVLPAARFVAPVRGRTDRRRLTVQLRPLLRQDALVGAAADLRAGHVEGSHPAGLPEVRRVAIALPFYDQPYRYSALRRADQSVCML